MDNECRDKLLLHLQCRFSNFSKKYTQRLLSGKDTRCMYLDFNVVKAGIRALNCYNTESENNCITEDEFYSMFNNIARIMNKYSCVCNEFEINKTKPYSVEEVPEPSTSIGLE